MDQAQIDLRHTGICSTDIAAIVGQDPYKSVWAVYNDKMGLAPKQVDTSDTLWGRRLQRVIADAYAEESGRKIAWLDESVRNKSRSWQIATPDFCHTDGPEGGEVKAPRYISGEWGESGTDNVPPRVLLQAAWQMSTMDWPAVVVVAFFGNRELRTYQIRRDQELEAELLDAAETFWKCRIELKSPPPIDATPECSAWLKNRFPMATEELRDMTHEEQALLARYNVSKGMVEEGEREVKALRNRIIERIGFAKGLRGPGIKALLIDVKGSEYTVKKEPYRMLKVSFSKEE